MLPPAVMNCRRALELSVIATLSTLAWTGTAHASEPWLVTGSLSVSTVLNEPYRDAFGVGAAADVGLYRPLVPWLLIGGRLGGVLLAEDQQFGQPSDDHGLFTMARFGAVLRLRPLAIGRQDDVRRSTGLWIEAGAGPGFAENGTRLHAILDGAVGYGFEAGALTIGPALRYQQVIETEVSFDGRDARLASLGVEVTFGDTRSMPKQRFAAPVATRDPDRDQDGILNDYDQCDGEPETYNGFNDHDGCPDGNTLELVGDRIVVDESVFFDFDESVVSPRGEATLRELHGLYQSKQWQFIRIEGHADARGTTAYNRDLGTQRANAVRESLIGLGIPATSMLPVSYGESAPIFALAHTEAQHALNRRVEFVVTPAATVAP